MRRYGAGQRAEGQRKYDGEAQEVRVHEFYTAKSHVGMPRGEVANPSMSVTRYIAPMIYGLAIYRRIGEMR